MLWSQTYLRRPLTPEVVLPAFLLTVAGLQIHLIEEYLTGFAPAMSRLYNISWSVNSYLMILTVKVALPAGMVMLGSGGTRSSTKALRS